MATATNVPRPMTPHDVRWIDPQTGKPTPEFYEYMQMIDALIRALRLEIP